MEQRKLKLARYFVAALFAIVATLFVITACGGGGAKHTLAWQYDQEKIEITVDGYKSLPDKVKEGEQITFTVAGKNGYDVKSVSRKGATTTNMTANSEGKYTLTVSADYTIIVEADRKISKVNVTLHDGVTFLSGDTVDLEDLDITVDYATGEKGEAPATTPGVVYNGTNGRLEMGDTSFSVRVGKAVSDPVPIPAVKTKIVIDAFGGTFAQEYKESLQNNDDFESATVTQENGGDVITLVYGEKLTTSVILPTVSKGNPGDFAFLYWYNEADENTPVLEISPDQVYSANIKAHFSAKLVELSRVYLETEQKSEDGATVTVPYLVIEGTFQAAESVYLFLYEGNPPPVELTGPTIDGGQRDKPFTLKFDLRELSATDKTANSFMGKWMDIRFRAEIGGRTEDMDINLERYADDFVDLDERINDGTYVYSFQTHTPDNTTQKNLKVLFESYTPDVYNYTMTAGTDEETGAPTLTISGTVYNEEYYGKTAHINWWISSNVDGYDVIGDDGTWSITFVLTQANGWAFTTSGYAHFNIIESEEDTLVVWQDNDGQGNSNLHNALYNGPALDKQYNGIGLITNGALRIVNSDNTAEYFFGKGTWGAIVYYGREIGRSFNYDPAIALKVDDMENPTKIFYVVTVTVEGWTEEELGALLFGNIDSSRDVYKCTEVEEVTTGVYRLWFDITAYEGGQLWPNLYNADDSKFMEIRGATDDLTSLYAVTGEKAFTIKVEYAGACVVPDSEHEAGSRNPETADPDNWPEVTPVPGPEPDTPTFPEDGEYTLTNVDLAVENDKVYFILSGTFANCTKEQLLPELETVYFDLETNANMGAAGWARSTEYERTVSATDTEWTIKFDITKLTESATPHFTKTESGSFGDIKLDTEHAVDGKTVELNGIVYKIFNQPENPDEGKSFWHNVGLVVTDKRMEGKSYRIGAAELAVDNDNSKVYYIVVVTLTGFSEEELASLNEFIRFGDKGKESDMYDLAKFDVVDEQAHTYKLYFDITDRPVDAPMLYAHLFVYAASQDIKDTTSNGKTVTFNGKVYTIKCIEGDPQNGGTWGMSNLFVTAE